MSAKKQEFKIILVAGVVKIVEVFGIIYCLHHLTYVVIEHDLV